MYGGNGIARVDVQARVVVIIISGSYNGSQGVVLWFDINCDVPQLYHRVIGDLNSERKGFLEDVGLIGMSKLVLGIDVCTFWLSLLTFKQLG